MDAHSAVVEIDVHERSDNRAERLGQLFDRHHDRLYRLGRRLAATRTEAEDLVQETFLRVARSSRMPPAGVKHEEAWLVRILINIRRDQWRRAAVRRHASSVLARVDATADSVESALIARDRVWRALDVLAPRRRAVIVMHDIDDMSVPSIAAVLGISAVTVRWHLARGRRELTRRLASEQGDPK